MIKTVYLRYPPKKNSLSSSDKRLVQIANSSKAPLVYPLILLLVLQYEEKYRIKTRSSCIITWRMNYTLKSISVYKKFKDIYDVMILKRNVIMK